jgi:hypothetical protein
MDTDESHPVIDRFLLAAAGEIAVLEEHVRIDHEALARVWALQGMWDVVASAPGSGSGSVAAQTLAICVAQVRCAVTGEMPADPAGLVITFTELAGQPCCDLHKPGIGPGGEALCCDPDDCGPCCENCPTCPVQPFAIAEDDEEPPAEDFDPGPGCDDEGGMSEFRHAVPDGAAEVHAQAAADVREFGGPDGDV